MFSELLKLSAHSLPSVLYSSFPLIASTVSNLLPSGNVKEDLLVTVVSSSRVTGVPIRTTLPQIQPGFLDVGSLVLACLVIMLASGSAIWVRSPAQDTRQYGRIRKEEPPLPPPPPPPPPPAADESGKENAGDDGPGDMNGGDGDDDPQQDVGTDGEDARPADGLATAAAPAPEDPPPPPNDIEEDDDRDDDDVPVVLDSLPWIFLVLMALLIGKRPVPATTTSHSPPVADASEPTLLIQGLLQRPLRPISIGQEQAALSLDPQVFKQVGIAVVAGAPSVAPIRPRVHWLVWRNTFAFLAALPALIFLITIVRLLLPPGTISRIFNVGRLAQEPTPPLSTVAQDEESEPQSPAAPDPTPAHPASDSVPGRTPTDPTDPAAGSASSFPPGRVRAFIRLEALLAGHPAPLAASAIPAPSPAERDVSTQEKRNRMVSVLRPATATRMARYATNFEGSPEKTNQSREKNDRVRAVQREIWAKMRELRLEGAVEDGPQA
ncbi:hypothetical protein DFH06DRAFT_1118960 [Mycena polygramma]|nr:hypothetical protein DFH06DRAFT_1118960 [Mycena polygramma]